MRQARMVQRLLRNSTTRHLSINLGRVGASNVCSLSGINVGSSHMRCLSGNIITSKHFSTFKSDYDGAAAERALSKIVPKPLDAEATAKLCELLKAPPAGEEAFLLDLLTNR